jgi:hypothetical protein
MFIGVLLEWPASTDYFISSLPNVPHVASMMVNHLGVFEGAVAQMWVYAL